MSSPIPEPIVILLIVFGIPLIILAILLLWRSIKGKGYVCFAPTKINLNILRNCPTIRDGIFKPTLYLQHPLLQSIAANFLSPRLATIQYNIEELKMPGGGHTTLAWPRHKDNNITVDFNNILVVVIPGLTGAATEPYVIELVSNIMKSGYKCVVYHPRLNGEKFILPEQGHMDIVTDFKATIDYILKKEENVKLFGVGHSFGANLLLNYLGTHIKDHGFIGGASIANPFNLILSESKIRGSIMDRFLASNLWRRIIRSKSELIKSRHVKPDIYESKHQKGVRIYDKLFSIEAYGYLTVDDYYWNISSHRKFKDINVPFFMFQAHDDIAVASNAFIKEDIKSNPNVIFKMTSRGGHLGWIEGFFSLRRWYIKPVIEYIDAITGMIDF